MGLREEFPREESTYRNMKTRCNNPNATGYENYGGRGITVCERWLESFENFYKDMGPRPENTSLDRIDVHGNYDPSNCRWADWETQANNRTDNTILEYNGESKTIHSWAKELGILENTISYRLLRKWSIEEALEKTSRIKNPRANRINRGYNGKLTDEEIIKAVELRKAGKTNIEIGKLFNIDNSQISRLMKRLEVIPAKTEADIKHERINKLYTEGKTYEEIKKITNIPLSSISYAINKIRNGK